MDHFEIEEQRHYLGLKFGAREGGNALSFEAAKELEHIVKKYARWRRPVVVTSLNARFFCSGGHLTDYKKLKTKAAGIKVNREIERALDRFAAWPAPKLAVIEGDVLGGGLEWLSRFDFRWSTPSALFAFWQRRVGLSSGWGGGRRWAELLGEERIRQLLIESRILSAEHARDLGLLDRVIAGWKIHDECKAWCEVMASPTVEPLLRWSAKSERRLFEQLWFSKLHRQILSRWK